MSLQFYARSAVLFLLVSLSTGCAITSVFSPYPNQAEDYKAAMSSNLSVDSLPAADAVLKDLNEDRDSADAMLYMMERGRIAQIVGRFEESKADYQLVIDGFEKQDLAATVDVSEVGAQGASLLTNDNAIPYSGAGYERVFVHHQQALNYWAQKDLEGASVEFRKIALEQQILLEQYESEIAEAHEEAEEKKQEEGANTQADIDELSKQFVGLDTVAGQVKSSFQNAYTFYHSAAFWEATGELNNALVDYKKALEINPESKMLKQDAARVSAKLGMATESSDTNSSTEDQGTIVLLFEDGFIPAKTETKLVFPNFSDGGIISVAFPFYDTARWPKSSTLSVSDDLFNDFGTTDQLVDFGALAVKDLKEQIPMLITRQILRGIAKNELQKQSGDHLGLAGQLVANIYNYASESADRRSWLTLPHTGQAMRINLKEGRRELTLKALNTFERLAIDVEAGKTKFVRIIHVNNKLISQIFPL